MVDVDSLQANHRHQFEIDEGAEPVQVSSACQVGGSFLHSLRASSSSSHAVKAELVSSDAEPSSAAMVARSFLLSLREGSTDEVPEETKAEEETSAADDEVPEETKAEDEAAADEVPEKTTAEETSAADEVPVATKEEVVDEWFPEDEGWLISHKSIYDPAFSADEVFKSRTPEGHEAFMTALGHSSSSSAGPVLGHSSSSSSSSAGPVLGSSSSSSAGPVSGSSSSSSAGPWLGSSSSSSARHMTGFGSAPVSPDAAQDFTVQFAKFIAGDKKALDHLKQK